MEDTWFETFQECGLNKGLLESCESAREVAYGPRTETMEQVMAGHEARQNGEGAVFQDPSTMTEVGELTRLEQMIFVSVESSSFTINPSFSHDDIVGSGNSKTGVLL